ncbi:MAG: nucleoside kinase [Vicinamibacteria bacterium]
MSQAPPRVVAGTPRATAQARLPDGRRFDAPPGTPLAELVRAAARGGEPPAIAALLGGRLRELTEPLLADAELAPVTLADADGARIYRRSLVFLLVTAAAEELPQAEIHVQHAATSAAAYYCEVRGRAPLAPEELARIEARMRAIVAEDAPISRRRVSHEEALALFEGRGEREKARLYAHRDSDGVVLYGLRGRWDCFQGYMAPSAGYLPHFALAARPPGFMLYFPHRDRPGLLEREAPYPKLFEVFAEAARWMERLGIRSAGELNDAIADGRLREVILVTEALHSARVSEIAAQIAREQERLKVVLVAGPSSSGKTTFAKRLAVQLLARGVRPFPLSLDDYFLPRQLAPAGADGRPDFESLAALDLALLEEQLGALAEGREQALPRYDFRTGERRPGAEIELGPSDVLIVEGIHGLNPRLARGLPPQHVFRVYVSALTQLNLDRHNRVSTTDCRLVRRVVRDAASRGYPARVTLSRWEAVTRAEKENIFAFQEHADAIFNSALLYEPAVLHPLAEPLLLQVRPDTAEFVEAKRLLSLLRWFEAAAHDHVPGDSILREFVGGSILEGFRPWPPLRPGARAQA